MLDPDAMVGVAHPIEITDAIGGWGDVFADYELLQPFPQLGRETFVPTPAEQRTDRTSRLDGVEIDSLRFLGLERRMWDRPVTGDGGYLSVFSKPLPGGASFVLELDRGLYAGDPRAEPTQRIMEARIRPGRGLREPTFSSVGAVTASEILRDLEWLRS